MKRRHRHDWTGIGTETCTRCPALRRPRKRKGLSPAYDYATREGEPFTRVKPSCASAQPVLTRGRLELRRRAA